MAKITLGDILGGDNVEAFDEFDMTEVQKVLKTLGREDAFDIAQCEYLQQRSLYGAELLIDMSAKMVKTVGFLEAKINTLKNRCALEYKGDDKVRITAEMRKSAAESDPKVEELSFLLARAKGARQAIDKKMDLLIKSFYHYKEVSNNQRQGIVSGTSKGFGGDREDAKHGKVEW